MNNVNSYAGNEIVSSFQKASTKEKAVQVCGTIDGNSKGPTNTLLDSWVEVRFVLSFP